MKYSEKNKFIKERWGAPLLNFEGGPRFPLQNFEEDPGVLLLNFRGVPGPTFKLSVGSRVPGPSSQGPGSQGPGTTFTPWHCLKSVIATPVAENWR